MKIKNYILKKLQVDFQFSKIIKREEFENPVKLNSRYTNFYNDNSKLSENFHRPICKIFSLEEIDFKDDKI